MRRSSVAQSRRAALQLDSHVVLEFAVGFASSVGLLGTISARHLLAGPDTPSNAVSGCLGGGPLAPTRRGDCWLEEMKNGRCPALRLSCRRFTKEYKFVAAQTIRRPQMAQTKTMLRAVIDDLFRLRNFKGIAA